MKYYILICLYHAIKLLMVMQIYSEHAGFFDLVFTQHDYKFIMIEVVSIAVSIHFLFKTEDAKTPTPWGILINVLVNTAFIVITYQWAIDENVSLWVPMIISFFLGTFGFVILNVFNAKVAKMSDKFFNDVYNWARDKWWPSKSESE